MKKEGAQAYAPCAVDPSASHLDCSDTTGELHQIFGPRPDSVERQHHEVQTSARPRTQYAGSSRAELWTPARAKLPRPCLSPLATNLSPADLFHRVFSKS